MARKILLVDDEIHLLESLAVTLRKFDVETESDSRLALQKLKTHDYAVVVSDMRMPGLDGIELLRAASYEAPDTTRLMLTGHGDMDTAMSAINTSGVFKFMTKPVGPSEIREALNAALAEHDRKVEEAELREAALHDQLTGLPNRTLYMDRFRRALARARRSKVLIAVLFIDLDGFKEVNDTYGHDAGDKVLQEVAQRLVGRIRENDSVARFGGDEFVVLLPDLETASDAETVARELVTLMAEPVEWNDLQLKVGASIGLSYYPLHGKTMEKIMTAADAAMYAAKRQGGRKCAIAEIKSEGQ